MKEMPQSHEQDFLAAYEAYADAIFRFALYRIRNREKAKDIVQETFLRTWKYMSEKGSITLMRAFLYKVALRLIINESVRKKAESLEAFMEATGIEDIGDSEDARIIRQDFLDGERIMQQLDSINPKYSEVIRLRFVEELGPKEIAHVLDESENVVSVRLSRALQELRSRFKKQYE